MAIIAKAIKAETHEDLAASVESYLRTFNPPLEKVRISYAVAPYEIVGFTSGAEHYALIVYEAQVDKGRPASRA